MCHATRINDQMHCGKCGMQWDIDDPNPPACRETKPIHAARREYLKFIKEKLNAKQTRN